MTSGKGGIGREEIKQPYSCFTSYSSHHSAPHLINSAIFAYKGPQACQMCHLLLERDDHSVSATKSDPQSLSGGCNFGQT